VAQGFPGRLKPRIILTFLHYKGGRSSAKSTGRLYPRRNPWYSLSDAESTSGHMVLSGVTKKKSPVTPPGNDPGTFRLVAQCLNHYATSGHMVLSGVPRNKSPVTPPGNDPGTFRLVAQCLNQYATSGHMVLSGYHGKNPQ